MLTVEYQKIIELVSQINPAEYAKTRNYLDGKVTYLSPYISRGIISTKDVYEKIREKYDLKNCEKLIQELAWREFFQRVLQHKTETIQLETRIREIKIFR